MASSGDSAQAATDPPATAREAAKAAQTKVRRARCMELPPVRASPPVGPRSNGTFIVDPLRKPVKYAPRLGIRRSDALPAILIEVVDPAGTAACHQEPEALHLSDLPGRDRQREDSPPLPVECERLVDRDPFATLGAVLPQVAVIREHPSDPPGEQDIARGRLPNRGAG